MTNKKETAAERLARMKKEKEAAKEVAKGTDIVGQLTHENDGQPDFSSLVNKLENWNEKEAKGENVDYVKMTIYIQKDIAKGFNALCVRRGDQKKHANQALAEYVARKARELGL